MKIGVVIGRFQSGTIHAGHAMLIEYVKEKSDKVLIVVGQSKTKFTTRNPLSFEIRKLMLENTYKKSFDYKILMQTDCKYDSVWNHNLDVLIDNNTRQDDEVTLYTGRDGFSETYDGKYKVEVKSFGLEHLSASDKRDEASSIILDSKEWREGVIYASANKFPISYQTVDIAIVDYGQKRVLLGRKPEEAGYRFVGGFVDATDDTLEAAAKRETQEEVKNIEVGDFQYIGSMRVDDWRYKKEKDKILTAFFKCTFVYGIPRAADDIAEVTWVYLAGLDKIPMEPEHAKLRDILLNNLNKSK